MRRSPAGKTTRPASAGPPRRRLQQRGPGGDATVAGGNGNTASGTDSAVAGGSVNTASGEVSAVAGGAGNTASGSDATVAGGYGNTASSWELRGWHGGGRRRRRIIRLG